MRQRGSAATIERMIEDHVAGFLPSTHGFHFANAWPSGPTIRFGPLDLRRLIGVGDASAGLCGGMVYTVADLFAAGVAGSAGPRAARERLAAVPRDRAPPGRVARLADRPRPVLARGSALGGSFGGDRAKPGVRASSGRRLGPGSTPGGSSRSGLIRADVGRSSPPDGEPPGDRLGLREDGRGVTLNLYDPNWPDRDDVTVTVHLDPALRPIGLSQSTGEPLAGWIALPYRAAPPPALR